MIPEKISDAPIKHWYCRYFFGDSPVPCARAFYDENYETGMHIHDFTEINVIVSGSGYHYINNSRFAIGKNDIFLIPPGYLHGYYAVEPITLYHVLLHPSFFTDYAADMRRLPAFPIVMTLEPAIGKEGLSRHYLSLGDNQMATLLPQLQTFAALYTQTGTAETAVLQNALGLYITAYICEVYAKMYMSEGENFGTITLQILSCVQYIQEHVEEEITIQTLEKIATVSRATLFRYFDRFIGLSPMNYLTNYRLVRARELLRDEQMPITQIAEKCGFCDTAHLDKTFRKAYGMTPNGYRKQCRCI